MKNDRIEISWGEKTMARSGKRRNFKGETTGSNKPSRLRTERTKKKNWDQRQDRGTGGAREEQKGACKKVPTNSNKIRQGKSSALGGLLPKAKKPR